MECRGVESPLRDGKRPDFHRLEYFARLPGHAITRGNSLIGYPPPQNTPDRNLPLDASEAEKDRTIA
ncbi:MAG: hypothetical protein CL933_17675 [Deltaproteobacteria bacterium]|nr:hypothetical protein [Deltaproteobacteria bacterium]